jgi:predicted enzyme related to lactoylglutathione lyase
MKNYLGRMIVLVEDYDQAFTFYSKNFGFEKIFELTTDVGQRFLHIGSGGTGEAGIWFLKAEGKLQQSKVGSQTGEQPAMVIYTSNLHALYMQLSNNGVRIKTEPVITPGYSFLHCYDLYGNEIVVVELV